MLLRADPDVSIAPFTEFAQLLHFRMRVLNIVFDRQPGGIVHSNVAAKSEEYPAGLVC